MVIYLTIQVGSGSNGTNYVLMLTLTARNFLWINHGDRRVFSMWNYHKCIMSQLGLSASFEYLCYRSMVIIHFHTLSARGPSLDVRIWRLKTVPALKRIEQHRGSVWCFFWYLTIFHCKPENTDLNSTTSLYQRVLLTKSDQYLSLVGKVTTGYFGRRVLPSFGGLSRESLQLQQKIIVMWD